MSVIFVLSLFLIFYAYAGYPLVLFLISLLKKDTVQRKEIEPMLTFLICAYNEEKSIRTKLEIIVASDASSDATDKIVQEFQDRGVKLLRVEGRVGKTEVQNQAVKAAKGDIIVFSDATTTYDRAAIRKIVRNYADPRVGAVSGRYRYLDPNRTQIGTGTIAFWDYENFIKAKQTQVKTVTGCCGCIYSVRKDLYVPLPPDIISDLVEPLKILEKGAKIVFEPEALAYETTCEKSEEEFKMRVRVISRGMGGVLYVKHLLNPFRYGYVSFQLLSHKVLRWMIPVLLIILYISNAFLIGKNTWYFVLFWLQSLFYFSAIVARLCELAGIKRRLLSFPLYFCVVNGASLIALFRTLLRKRDVTWKTVR